MTARPDRLDERMMRDAEERIPELASKAGRDAHARALQKVGKVWVARNAEMVELRADGTSVVVGSLPPPTRVQRGLVLVKRSAKRG